MNKLQFLRDLEQQLKALPVEEQQEILRDYHEYFLAAETEGKSEQQVIDSLGSPKQLAKELLATHYIDVMEHTPSTKNILRAMWAGVGLSFLNIVFVLGPFLGIVGALIGFWVAGLALIFSPMMLLAGVVLSSATFSWFEVFVSMTFCGLGLLACIGCYYFTNLLKNLSIRYLKFNVAIIKGEPTHA